MNFDFSVGNQFIPSQVSMTPHKEEEISNESQAKENTSHIKKKSEKVKRAQIAATGILPISSRGIWSTLLYSAIMIPKRFSQSRGPEFKKNLKEHLAHDWDWNQGIQDSYINLESAKHADLRKQVVEENFRYAAYMYKTIDVNAGGDKGILLSPTNIKRRAYLPAAHSKALSQIMDQFTKMGFQVDRVGNFYHLETGSMFNLIYDSERKEVVICLMGLDNQESLYNIAEEQKKKIEIKSKKAVGAEWLGGIPPAARQAIEIGKMLKEISEQAGMTPVMVGHSHGGGLAQTGAVANGIKGVVFNSRPMGAGVRRYIGQSTIAENAKHITAFSGKGDWLSGIQAVNYLAIIFERVIGIPVPRTVGTGYQMPYLTGESMSSQHYKFYEELEALKNMP